VRKLSELTADLHPAGFYTAEIRSQGQRQGFQLVSLTGEEETLSHVRCQSPHRVGRYGVNVEGFEAFLSRLNLKESPSPFILLDEIGKMECFSRRFREEVQFLLDSGKTVLAVVAQKGGEFPRQVRSRQDCSLWEVSLANRARLPVEIERAVRRALACA